MAASKPVALALAVAALASCARRDIPKPVVASVAPSTGYVGLATAIVIRGRNFAARVEQPSSGGSPAVDTSYRAWIGDATSCLAPSGCSPAPPCPAELEVTWKDPETLEAVVPACLPAGAHPLVVESPFGRQARLDGAFLVSMTSAGALAATVAAQPPTASVGQAIEVVMTVSNPGSGPVEDVAPAAPSLASADGAAAALATGPEPASVASLAPGASATFRWTYTAGSRGHLAISGGASGTDTFSSSAVATPAVVPVPVLVQTPPALTATLAPAPSTPLGVTFPVTMTVVNGGDADALDVAPTALTLTPGSLPIVPVDGPAPAKIRIPGVAAAPDNKATFTWHYNPGVNPGTAQLRGGAAGTDVNDPLSTVTAPEVLSSSVTVGRSAMTAALAVTPAVASLGQIVTLTLSVTNTGSAPVSDLVPAAVIPSGTGTASVETGPVPLFINPLGVGETKTFVWTYRAQAAGSVSFTASASGTDSFSGNTVSTNFAVSNPLLTLQTPAALAPTLTASRTTASTSQAVTLTLALRNTGTATASVTALTPTWSPTTGATCTAASPVAPQAILGGATASFTWTCTATAAGAYTYGATVVASDVNTGQGLLAPVTVTGAAVTVQTAAALAATLTAPAVASTGQAVTVTLALRNTGTAATGAAASATAVTPTWSPSAGATCTAAAPLPPQPVAGGATVTFTWTCTATTAAPYSYGATLAANDVNTALPLNPAVTPVTVTVQPAGILAPTLAVTPRTTLDVGQVATVTLTLKNNGVSGASVTAVTPTVAPTTGATCTAATPAPPQSIAGGATATLAWTCTATAVGPYTYGVTVAAADVVSGFNISPTVTGVPVTVQTAAVLAPTLTAALATASTGQAVTLTLALKNNGTAGASVSAVTPTTSPATGATCTAAGPVPPQAIAGGATATFTWTCTATAAAVYTYGATVAATDVNTGLAINPTVTGAPVTVQSPAVLAPTLSASRATASTGQAVTLTLALKNNGTAGARVSAVTPTIAPATGSTCTAASPVPPQAIAGGATVNFTWTCTATAAAAYTYGATVAATDVNSGGAINPAVTGAPVTVQTAAVLAPTLTASAATASTGQAVTLTLSLKNNGTAGASASVVTPTASPATGVTCTTATPAPPQTIAGGATVGFTWTCTATAAAAYTYGATVAAADVNSGTSVAPTVTGVAVTVQAAAVLTPTLTASRATASTGQAVTLTLALTNAGTSGASVSAVTPSASPAASCTAAAPATPLAVAAGATATFTWTCTASSAGSYAYGATVAATDAVSGASINPAVTGTPVTVQTAAVLAPTLTASTPTASTGQAVTLTLALKNNGTAGASATAVTPTASPSAGVVCTAPSPAPPQTIAGGATATFSWTCTASVQGNYSYGATVAAADVNSGANVSPTVTGAAVTVQPLAALAPTLTASPGIVSTGQAATVTLVLRNNGASGANVTSVSPTASPTTGVSCGPASPAPPQSIAGGASATFTWTCTSTAAGPYTYGATVVATDAVSGASINPTVTGAPVTVQTAAVLAPTLTALPGTVSTSQAATLTLVLRNNGTSGATVTGVTPTASPAAGATCSPASPAPPQSIAGGGATATFVWTCTSTSAGAYTYGATVAAIDAVSGASIGPAVTGAPVTVQAAAVLAPTLTPSSSTASTGQAVTLTLALRNNGSAGASVTAVTPTSSPAAACSTPSPAPPQTVGGGAVATFTWTCTAATQALYSYGATVAASDVNSGANVSPTVTAASVNVLQAGILAPTLTPSTSTASTGQAVTLSLALKNNGASGANVSAVTPNASPSAPCTAASPAPPQSIAGGATATFTWTCTASTGGSYTYGATVAATDAVSGANISPVVTGAGVTVQAAATLAPTLAAVPTTVSTGQAATLTLSLKNNGGASANVVAVGPTRSPTASSSCTAANPATATVPGGASQDFTWTCTATAAGTYTYGATVGAFDANSGANVSPTVTGAPVTVQGAAALNGSVAAIPSTVDANQAIALTLTVNNTGQVAAVATAATPTKAGTASASCTAASPASQTIGAGSSGTFTWSCTPTTTGSLVLGAGISGTDANSGATVSATATAANVTVQSPAALSATVAVGGGLTTVSAGQVVSVTMTVTNTGGAAASATSASASHGGTAAATCSAPSPASQAVPGGGAASFTWTCTPSSAGSLVLGGSASGSDANTGAAVGATASPQATLTVQTGAAFSASVAASRSTATVGQSVSFTLTVNDTGQAGANVTAVAPTVSGGSASCGSASPVPQAISGGGSGTFTWSCTVSSAAALSFGATVSGTDANSGAAVGPATATPATVTGQTAPAVAATSFSASPNPVNTSQATAVSLTLSNTGGAGAVITTVAPSITPATGSVCGSVSPSLPHTIVGGGNATFTWSCSSTTARSYNLNATLGATDANTGGSTPTPNLANVSLTVQTPASLTVTLSGPGTPIAAGAAFDVTMTVTDGGDASAINVQPSLSVAVSGTGASVTLSAGPTPAPPGTAAPGAPAVFTWTYTNGTGGAGTADFTGSATATDGTSGASIGPVGASLGGVGLDGSGALASTSALATGADGSAGPALAAVDPLGDGTAQAFLAAWGGAVWVGPSRDGARLARLDPAGGAATSSGLAIAVDAGPTPAASLAWSPGPAATIGSPGCLPATTGCGPDGEAGAALLAAGPLGGAERLWIAGAGPAGSRYLYVASSPADPLALAFQDLRDPLAAAGAAGWAPLPTAAVLEAGPPERLYLGYAGRGPGGGPVLLALQGAPAFPGLDAVAGVDALDLQAGSMPGIAGAAPGPGITALASLGGVLYVGHEGGIVRSAATPPGPAADAPGDWTAATPAAAAWSAKASVALPPVGTAALRDRAVAGLAAFGSCATGPCVYAARNVRGDATQPAVVPQLWRCDPSAGPARCGPGDWRLAAGNAFGDLLLSQLGEATNSAVTVLAATPRWLYLGLDNGSTGVQLYRAAAAPAAAADFQGQGGCAAGTPGCQGLGGNGFGDPTATRFLDFKAVESGGVATLWVAVGDGNGPLRVYRIPD